MSMWKSFGKGNRQTRSYWQVLLIIFLFNLVVALLLTFPFWNIWGKSVGYSMAGKEIASELNMKYLLDFFITKHDSLTASYPVPLFLGVGIVYLLLNTFFAGGAIGLFHREDRFTLEAFFRESGRWFWRFLRLLLISLVFIAVLFLINLLWKGIADSALKESAHEPLIFWMKVLRYAVIGFLLLFINMVFDYAKISTVVSDERRMIRTALRSFGFVFSHPGRTLGLYYMVAIVGAILLALYLSVSYWVLPATIIVLTLIWQQLYSVARVWVRLLFFSSQMALYKTIVPAKR